MTQRKRELTKTLTIRLPEPVLKRLKVKAKHGHRKLSDYVRLVLQHVDQHGMVGDVFTVPAPNAINPLARKEDLDGSSETAP